MTNFGNINPLYQGQFYDKEDKYTVPYGAGIPLIVYDPEQVDFEIEGYSDPVSYTHLDVYKRQLFTTENFTKMLDPVYLDCFVQSFKLAFSTTLIVIAIGYPFGYFMAKLSERGKKLMMFLIMVPFWTSSLIRLYGWIIILQAKGIFNSALMGLGIIDEPLKILYSYPAVLIGMVYALLPFMILAVYSSVEKMDWSLVAAARDLGASPVRACLLYPSSCV